MNINDDDLDLSGLTKDEKKRYFMLAREGRKYEIDKFWQRSLFFWGFIGASFIAYSKASERNGSNEKLLVSCFGLICSLIWTLSNRGSKYWQEAWEHKVERIEKLVLGAKLFSHIEPRQSKGLWGAWNFSVSKLTIALSDFTTLIWFALLISAADLDYDLQLGISDAVMKYIILSIPLIYIVLLLIFTRRTKRPTPTNANHKIQNS